MSSADTGEAQEGEMEEGWLEKFNNHSHQLTADVGDRQEGDNQIIWCCPDLKSITNQSRIMSVHPPICKIMQTRDDGLTNSKMDSL